MLRTLFKHWRRYEILWMLVPWAKYRNESYYWRFTGIILVLLLIGNRFATDYINEDLNLFIYVILGIYLLVHLMLRTAYVSEDNPHDLD